MSERSKIISKLKENKTFRAAYIKAKLNVLIPSQIRALRLKSEMPRQEDLAREAQMKQPRISAVETPGAVNFNLETLVRLASAFKVGLIVRFVSFSEMLRWENEFSQDAFQVVILDKDAEFQRPEAIAEVDSMVLRDQVRPSEPASSSSVDQMWKSLKGEGQQPRAILDAMIGAKKTGGLTDATLGRHSS